MTDRERNALKKRRPNVQSWTRLLAAAENEHLDAMERAPKVNSPEVMALIPKQAEPEPEPAAKPYVTKTGKVYLPVGATRAQQRAAKALELELAGV